MMKIEMTIELSDENPAGRSREFIWMMGAQWPIQPHEDKNITRIEVWGPELDITKDLENGTDHAEGRVRQWKRPHVASISQKMRAISYAQP